MFGCHLETNNLVIKMIKFLKLIYSQCYYFYSKVWVDDEPHAMTIWIISVTETFYIGSVANYFYATKTCELFPIWIYAIIFGCIVGFNYLLYFKRIGKETVVKTPVLLLNSKRVTAVSAFVFFLGGFIIFIGFFIYMKAYAEAYCN